MKYASSIRFGGQLVDAKDCDYEDYKRLGLLCPECKDPVFLKAEGTRQQGGKEVKIGAHFSHFATKNPELAKVCENRVKSYTQADIDRAIARAKGQRLKLLQRWFWSVYVRYWGEENIDTRVKLAADIASSDLHTLSLLSICIKQGGTDKFTGFVENFMNVAFWGFVQEERLAHHSQWLEALSRFDEVMHAQICKEIFAFLLSSKQEDILKQIILHALASFFRMHSPQDIGEWQDIKTDVSKMGILVKSVFMCMTNLVVQIPWADEFARLSAESKVGAT